MKFALFIFILFVIIACENSITNTSFDLDNRVWRLVVLPDTQCYTVYYPQILRAQVDWILEAADELNIRFVAHVGDIVHNNNHQQWRVAKDQLGRLSGNVPFVLVPGNHDMGENGGAGDRSSLMDQYFKLSDFGDRDLPSGSYDETVWNSYHHFYTYENEWLVLGLEFAPRDDVLEWANEVVDDNGAFTTIVVTHSYLYSDNSRYDHRTRSDQEWSPYSYGLARQGGINDGEQIWQKFISRHDNIQFVFSGHVLNDGVGYLSSTGLNQNVVHQLMANYQDPSGLCLEEGGDGNGFLRVVEINNTDRSAVVYTYSPWLNEFLDDEQNYLVLAL